MVTPYGYQLRIGVQDYRTKWFIWMNRVGETEKFWQNFIIKFWYDISYFAYSTYSHGVHEQQNIKFHIQSPHFYQLFALW